MKSAMNRLAVFALVVAGSASSVLADELVVPMKAVSPEGVGKDIGTIAISEQGKGLIMKIAVTGIPDGEHGFHVHENGDCGPGEKDGKQQAAIAAGPHYDPTGSKSHNGPGGEGHHGDMPVLKASSKAIDTTVDIVHLKLDDLEGRSLVIHEASDNYTNVPENGGSAGRIACGVIPKS